MKKDNINSFSGIIDASMVEEFKLSRESFYKFVKEHNYEKVGPGMYVAPDELVDELLVLHKRCPNGVISHDEALYFYGLIDREPFNHTITVYSGYNAKRLTLTGYKVNYVNKDLLELGKITVIDNFGNRIPMYDLERTIIDLIRNRSKFEIQDYATALKAYSMRTDKDLNKLYEYGKAFKVEKSLRMYMEVLL